MTWEALSVIVVVVTAFAVLVSGFAWLSWKRLDRLDREVRGDIRLSRKDRQALTADQADPWWASR